MTASQPATPGSDREVCACGHRLAHHVSVGGCCIGACLCPAARPVAPSEPPAETQQDDEQAVEAITAQFDEWEVYCRGISNEDLAREAVRLAARPSADTEKLLDALRLIAGPAPHCAASTAERHACRQPGSGRTRGARYGADAWCDQCIARAALDAQ